MRGAERSRALRFIVCLGVVSLFADMTYEGARSIIGPFLEDLGASAAVVGLVAGFGEMLAAGLRFFSGRLADRTRAYWAITILGYAVNLVAVPALAFAGSWQAAALLIVVERTGKAIRGPARDVLLSSATGRVGHGWGFGLHAALDQAGAMLGPLLLVPAVARSGHFGAAFLRLAFPAAAALLTLAAARAIYAGQSASAPEAPSDRRFPPVFRTYIIAAALLALGYIDFALLSFHFRKTAVIAPAAIPLLYALAMGLNGLSALVLGRLFDRHDVKTLAAAILVALCALPLGLLGGPAGAVAGVVCWGIGLGAQDACLRPGIAQVVSMDKRGRAFGAFNAAFGIAWFLGSAAMGALYQRSLIAVVGFGAAAQLAAAATFYSLRGRMRG